MKKRTPKAKPAQTAQPQAPTAPPPGKCQAKEVGHRSCQCGSPDCGENIGQP